MLRGAGEGNIKKSLKARLVNPCLMLVNMSLTLSQKILLKMSSSWSKTSNIFISIDDTDYSNIECSENITAGTNNLNFL